MSNICFYNVKGGAGATVTACAVALIRAQAGPTTLFSAGDDALAVLGITGTGAAGRHRDLAVIGRYRDSTEYLGDIMLFDNAVIDTDADGAATFAANGTTTVLVTRNCFLAARAAQASDVIPTGIVVVEEPGRVLSPDDMADVIGAPLLAVIPFTPPIARAVDAGLFASRAPTALTRTLTTLAFTPGPAHP